MSIKSTAIKPIIRLYQDKKGIRPNSLHISCQGGYVGMVDLCLPESTL